MKDQVRPPSPPPSPDTETLPHDDADTSPPDKADISHKSKKEEPIEIADW